MNIPVIVAPCEAAAQTTFTEISTSKLKVKTEEWAGYIYHILRTFSCVWKVIQSKSRSPDITPSGPCRVCKCVRRRDSTLSKLPNFISTRFWCGTQITGFQSRSCGAVGNVTFFEMLVKFACLMNPIIVTHLDKVIAGRHSRAGLTKLQSVTLEVITCQLQQKFANATLYVIPK